MRLILPLVKTEGVIMKRAQQSTTKKKSSFPATKAPGSDASRSKKRSFAGHKEPNEQSFETRDKALKALRRMRRENISLSKACREEHIKPSTLRRYVGSAVRQDKPGGRFRATTGDSFRRDLQIPTAHGMTPIRVYGNKNASLIASYLNAVSAFQRNKPNNLASFKGKTVKARGKVIELITDPAILLRLAEADVLHFDQLYASATGRG